jgi:hypothetical protein
MNHAASPIPLEGFNGVKSQRKSRLYLCSVIVRMDLFYNRKSEPILKILNIMILLSSKHIFKILNIILNSKYNFKILNIVFDDFLIKNHNT